MRWRGRRRSSNIERRRGGGSRHRAGLPFGLGGSGGGGKLGGKGIIILLVMVAIGYFTGINPLQLLGGGSGMPMDGTDNTADVQQGAGMSDQDQFIAVVLGSTEDVWQKIFAQRGERYQPAVLVDYQGGTRTACGQGDARMGPFYCPADKKVYLDQSFFDQLGRQYGAPGDFAQAYVMAHEVGHHIQTLWGISRQVHARRQQVSETQGNVLSVKQELQADCFAGVWAHYAEREGMLEAGDLDEGLQAASAVGDDTLQRKSRGTVVPESFTHGSAAQRQRWFKRGFNTGDVNECDTFSAAQL